MNLVWTSVMLIGISMMVLGNVDEIMNTLLAGGTKAVELSIKLWAIYTLWLGILKIVEDTGLDKKLSKLLTPVIRFLFGKQDEYTNNQIAINITSNILGMGNAALPSGLNAIKGLNKNRTGKYATSAMIMLVILNSTSLELLPTTVISLRASAGSVAPADIIIPTIIATLSSTVVGILLVKVCSKIFKDKN